MNALLLSMTLTAPAHPPAFPPPPPPVVVVRPRPPIVVVAPRPPIVLVPPRPPVVVVPVSPPPALYPPADLSVPVEPVAPAALTLGEFSRYFTPTPGKHDVWVVHPVTRQPVKVCFTLPPGKLRDFEVDKRSIRFEFVGGREVEIEFRNNGTVRVDYGD
ncbi:hypothetical protein R5W23_002730 [Gemmata sp. JC673]|uniref:DUF4397 domain-containing protein n=1 Tax=Gemmata algarum TaxID=2975278 RepID=A0ABU5F3X2_9BACT|nr:hypothetical protein [Gemmata algarum]MDY3561452.1 hypothetical protein [Gemmata algarum]